ncbi:mycothiol synthase [Nocardioides massiliensis]|uniref:Mycothiol acetyltransferase n=1 Tax=Nocardioides massiliensis TaxID=1325935 RepID=A0ABT9NMU6_9ACTN|nr:mycothiol synthase [Nocardioides massiliensis]MDP9821743.1 mycothiol synthase [Nocardioides massiliensis]
MTTGLDDRLRAAIETVAGAACDHDGADPLDEATRLALRHRDESEMAVWLAGDADAFALLVDGDLSLVTHPDARRRGLAATLLDEVIAAAGTEPLTAWSHGDHPAAVRLGSAYGFARVRELWVMRLTSVSDLPPVEVPEGLVVRGYRDADADEVVRINAAAFASHPEQGRMDRAQLAQRMDQDWFDPAGLLVAEDTAAPGRLLGFHWTKLPVGSQVGEVYVVGIDPAAQGRGLGRLLTLAGLHHLAGRGVIEVELYVEGDNHPAQRTYSGLGFTHPPADTHVQYRRDANSLHV